MLAAFRVLGTVLGKHIGMKKSESLLWSLRSLGEGWTQWALAPQSQPVLREVQTRQPSCPPSAFSPQSARGKGFLRDEENYWEKLQLTQTALWGQGWGGRWSWLYQLPGVRGRDRGKLWWGWTTKASATPLKKSGLWKDLPCQCLWLQLAAKSCTLVAIGKANAICISVT